MLGDQRASISRQDQDRDQSQDEDEDPIREIHAMTPQPPPAANRGRRREAWETSRSNISSSLSIASSEGSENFTTMSREFNALVIAGSGIGTTSNNGNESGNNTNLAGIGEDDVLEETNPLAIVPDYSPVGSLDPPQPSPRPVVGSSVSSVQRVKKEEVETKISAWQTAEIAKINNRFKREDAIIKGWENEQVQKSTSWMKKIERKLEEKRARAMEKMQNEVAKARRKAEERRASAEAKRGTKVATVVEVSNLMRAVGRPPAKRSFF